MEKFPESQHFRVVKFIGARSAAVFSPASRQYPAVFNQDAPHREIAGFQSCFSFLQGYTHELFVLSHVFLQNLPWIFTGNLSFVNDNLSICPIIQEQGYTMLWR